MDLKKPDVLLLCRPSSDSSSALGQRYVKKPDVLLLLVVQAVTVAQLRSRARRAHAPIGRVKAHMCRAAAGLYRLLWCRRLRFRAGVMSSPCASVPSHVACVDVPHMRGDEARHLPMRAAAPPPVRTPSATALPFSRVKVELTPTLYAGGDGTACSCAEVELSR